MSETVSMSAVMQRMFEEPPQGADKYVGAVASGYNAKREDSDKWRIEQRVVEDMLSDLPSGSWVLDVPCGTGRFFPFYASKGFLVKALDLSEDMLRKAAEVMQDNIRLARVGDARETGLEDKSVDAAVMVRLTRWLSPEGCVKALKEMQRVARKRIVFTARVRNHAHARPYGLIASALDGWKIARDEAGADMDYRIIELVPTG
jgi:ubiquinone/menaquinone biosynthesis C-methylase UbiE